MVDPRCEAYRNAAGTTLPSLESAGHDPEGRRTRAVTETNRLQGTSWDTQLCCSALLRADRRPLCVCPWGRARGGRLNAACVANIKPAS